MIARPPRSEYEGAVYHEETYGCVIQAYVLMTNHYHLLLETPRPNLRRVMHCMNGSYTTYVNSKRRKVGQLFQGRFQALIVDREAYLLELTRSIHLNPVRAAIVARPEAYP